MINYVTSSIYGSDHGRVCSGCTFFMRANVYCSLTSENNEGGKILVGDVVWVLD